MTDTNEELPVFPTSAPAVLCDSDVVPDLFTDVLTRLAAVVDIDDDQLGLPTPCAGFTVGELRSHTLGWLQFFAAALTDPAAEAARPDPESFALGDATPGEIVLDALASIHAAIAGDAASELVVMSGSRMAGDAVLGMALGEYIIHAWDLAAATGQPYSAPDDAVGPAHEFLQGMVAPEYRGPDSGFFDNEFPVADDASALNRLLGFAGRNPHWSPS